MKLAIALVFALVAAAAADDIDWSQVKPVYELPSFWKGREALGGPPAPRFEGPHRGGRIVGGQEAGRHQFTYQVGLLVAFPDGTGLCGGSVLSSTAVLTAAHW